MIAYLKPYPEYRESGHEWLGCIPSDWEVRKLKFLTRFVNGLPFKPGDWGASGTPIIRIQNLNGSRKLNYTNRRGLPDELLIRQGDLLFAWSGNRGTSFGPSLWKENFVAYLNQHIFKLVGYRLERRYFYYLLRAATIHIEEEKTHGIIGLVHVTKPELGSINVPIASGPDQAAIVRYLDWGNARLERTIRAKRRIIALLNEQKQAIIYRAVTCGLDPSAPLKPSGASWLGDIPVGWAVQRAKYLFREIDERSSTGSEELLSVSHLTGVTPRSQKNITMFKAESYVGHKLCRPGDLVINTMWAWMGALGISKDTGIISPAYAVYRQRGETSLSRGFIDALLRTRLYVDEFTRRSTGIRSSRLRMYPEEFFKVEILIPPRSEQEEIVSFISAHTANLNVAIERVSGEVDLLREYRTRLIADVVTGKLDVREAAAKLPDAAVELETALEQEPEELELEEELVEGE